MYYNRNMIKNVNYNNYRKRLKKAIESAKARTNVTDIYNSMGISRGNVSGFIKGNNSRLSIKTVELLIKKLEDPNASVTNQQRLSVSKPRKAASMLFDAFLDMLNENLTPNKKAQLSLDLEKWLRDSSK